MLVNAAREGLGYEIASEVIDMEPFYFEGINVAPADEQEEEETDQTEPTVNHAPEAAIEMMVVGVPAFVCLVKNRLMKTATS